ncbi:restriction endonuclease subunit S [Cytophaga hutchinsonii]|uniref:Type I site-specific deoxyribonuclease S subunit n=1 Tax=Cytophaga hutchinsonii (strain ATCC 33406 / DSM 1761 / CIP 103989 / NBRC 15051 / NCIMB 9469 / D465) TaxID=269798 RepID=A0A6N4SWB6_CYTH3|nr:restriction endonuclease subunit S [Cytophaga hutchinsonii]ABG60587.1 type I site-specific deoxyribonuclease S subunit [Cytophaga hutchinsonii ATCC 33406]
MRFPEFDEEWEEKTLGEICEMQAGKFVSASEIKEQHFDGLFPCYGGNGLRGYTKSYNYDGKYSLIGRQGALCGNVNFANGKFHATEHAVVVTPLNGINTVWMFYLLTNLNLNQFATGMAQPGLSVQNLEKVESTIPKAIDEQEKIASFLTLIDGRISTQNKIIKELELLIKSISQIIFHGHRYKFKKASLGSICTIKKGEQINSSVLSESGLYAVMNGGITPSGYYSQYNCVGNTISISEGGNSCGYVQFNDKKFWSGGHCYTLSEINAEISNKYLYYFMKFSENLIMSLRVGSGLPNIQKKDLEKFNVAFPEINQQYQISKFLDLLTEKIQVEKSLKTSLIRQKQYVLKKMFI